MNRNLVAAHAAAVLVTALAFAPRALAQAQDAGSPGEWLSQYAGARTLGMGGAFVAIADEPLGILWNPAGPSFMNQNQLHFENTRLFDDTSINAVGFTVPGSRWPSLGASVVSLGSGDFQRTNEMNDPMGTFREGETAWLLTTSKAFTPRFAVGVNLKLVQQTVEAFSANGFGADVGVMYELAPRLRFGGSLMNLGGPSLSLRDVAETYPTQFRGGFALRLFDERALVSVQMDESRGLGARFHGGAEYWLQPAFAVRMGWSQTGPGGGISYGFAPQYQLDYAAANMPLGIAHRVGLSYRFGGFFASSQAEPRVFSPTGERAVTRISLNARTKADPREWSVAIHNKADEVVRRFGGSGQPPSHLQWDGKDENGLPLPDGVYRYGLEVKDAAGRLVAGPVREIEISTGGPQGTVPLVPQTAQDGGAR